MDNSVTADIHSLPSPTKKMRIEQDTDPKVVMEVVESSEGSSEDEYDEDDEHYNSDSSAFSNSSDLDDFDCLPSEDNINKMPDGIEKLHLLSMSHKRKMKALEEERTRVKKERDELIHQKALERIPRWSNKLYKAYRNQQDIEGSQERILLVFYKEMYDKSRFNFIWTIHLEGIRIGRKTYNFYTKAGEYTNKAKFVTVVMQRTNRQKITCSNWEFGVVLEEKNHPELFGDNHYKLVSKIMETFAEFASITETRCSYFIQT